ncbi:acetylglutamate kinase [Oscillospiraceae bacterium PP1C4]
MYTSGNGAAIYYYTMKQIQLMNTFRKLWEQHVMWTRSFIISTAADLGDLALVTERLLRNPIDFANELKPFYGAQKAAKFEELLKEHFLIAAQLVTAAKAGDSKAVNEQRVKWYANADQIAAFLAEINPYWNQKMWQAMLYDHLKMTENEAVSRLTGQYAADIAQYDSIENQALKMADNMSYGIIKQFNMR